MSHENWCSMDEAGVHKYSDYTYWGEKHPKCDKCGFVDTSRIVNKGGFYVED